MVAGDSPAAIEFDLCFLLVSSHRAPWHSPARASRPRPHPSLFRDYQSGRSECGSHGNHVAGKSPRSRVDLKLGDVLGRLIANIEKCARGINRRRYWPGPCRERRRRERGGHAGGSVDRIRRDVIRADVGHVQEFFRPDRWRARSDLCRRRRENPAPGSASRRQS